jgi:chemotaxis protein CheD
MNVAPHGTLDRFTGRNLVKVGIADMKTSQNASDVIVTYALGSCIAVMVHDPKKQVGGMIHYMLPTAPNGEVPPGKSPCMFADLGVPMLFNAMYALGAIRENIVIKVAGGASINDDNGTFKIGKRNYSLLRKLLWKNNLMIASEDVGGSVSRTVRLDVSSGKVLLRAGGDERLL